MKSILIKWQKRLVWVPYFNFIFVFIRMFSSFGKKPIWKSYLKECALILISNLALSLPTSLLRLLFPQAATFLLLLMAWLFPVLYVHASIWLEENL